MITEDFYIGGILLSVEALDIEKNLLDVSKYKSGRGAIGVRCEFTVEGDQVVIDDYYITWIS